MALLPEQSLTEAEKAMNRVRVAVEQLAIPAGDGGAVVTISVGVAELLRERDQSPEDWLRRADAALYRAKNGGRNRVETAPPPLAVG